MAKKVTGYIKLQIPAAKATPAPPVGPALGQKGVNIVQFTKEFNARTADQAGMIIPVIITVYADRSFTFVCKTPPAAILIKKACNIQTASATPNKTKVATLSKADLQKIAETKMPDLNAASLEAAMSMIAGTARSMGVKGRRVRISTLSGRDIPANTTRRFFDEKRKKVCRGCQVGRPQLLFMIVNEAVSYTSKKASSAKIWIEIS